MAPNDGDFSGYETRFGGKSSPMSNFHGDRNFGHNSFENGEFHLLETDFNTLRPPTSHESTLVHQFSMDKGDPEPMPLPKRALEIDPREKSNSAEDFSTRNRSCAGLADLEPTPKLGCSTLGSLPSSSEKIEGKNSPPLRGAFPLEIRAQGLFAPQVPVKRAHGSRRYPKEEPHKFE